MAGKFEVKKASNGQFHFHLKASNGQVILTSELYTEKRGALNGIESVKRNAPINERYERKANKNGEPYFVLKASNGQVVGQSESYSSTAAMENGVESVKKNAPDAAIDLNLDVRAQVPGEYHGPASRAYLYYNSDAKYWTAPLAATIRAGQ